MASPNLIRYYRLFKVMNTKAALKVWAPNAPTLFSIAVDSAKRIPASPRVGGQKDALVSIVFAAASLEAFLNESKYLAETSLGRMSRGQRLGHRVILEPSMVSAFAQVMDEAEASRVQIQSKFQLAHLVLTGKAYDKGSAPYQNFSDLMAVRNLLMHGKSNESFLTIEGKPSVPNPVTIVERLASKNLIHKLSPGEKGFITVVGDTALADLILLDEIDETPPKSPAGGTMARWTFVVGTKAVAEWACRAAAQMATDLMDKAPKSNWKNLMEGQFRKVFALS
jgi:hypothetical protein